MILWKQLRILFLAVILGGVFLTLIKVLSAKSLEKPKSDNFRRELQVTLLAVRSQSSPMLVH